MAGSMMFDNVAVSVFTIMVDWAVSVLKTLGLESWGEALRSVADTTGEAIKRELRGLMAGAVVDYAQKHWGVVLDTADPFSRSSISGGLGQKIGIPLRDIFDREMLLADIGAGLAGMVNARYGTNLSTFWPLDSLQSELEGQVVQYLNTAVDEMYAETKSGINGGAGEG